MVVILFLFVVAELVAVLRTAGKRDQPILCVQMPEGFSDRMAQAIYLAEGGDKTRFPYGIKSLSIADRNTARAVCLRAIERRWMLWTQAGKPGGFPRGFVKAMGVHWCPPGVDPQGHKNWVKNVNGFLAKNK